MASAECIEQDSESITASEENSPESANLWIEPRFLNVGYAPPRTNYHPNFMPAMRKHSVRAYPRLLLQGRWLEKAGFTCGSLVAVWADQGYLTIEVAPEDAEPTEVPHLDSRSMAELNIVGDKLPCTITRNSTPWQFLSWEEEDNAYQFLGKRKINVPIVSKALGAAIVAQREAVGMTAKQAYVRAELPAAHYYGIEGGSRQPSLSVFLSVCEALAIHPKELFNRVLEGMHYPDATRAPEIQVKLAPQQAPPRVGKQREKAPPPRSNFTGISNPHTDDLLCAEPGSTESAPTVSP